MLFFFFSKCNKKCSRRKSALALEPIHDASAFFRDSEKATLEVFEFQKAPEVVGNWCKVLLRHAKFVRTTNLFQLRSEN